MSGWGQSRRFDCLPPTSALPPSTDIVSSARQVRFVPVADVQRPRTYAVSKFILIGGGGLRTYIQLSGET
jgi:hypothetical protein